MRHEPIIDGRDRPPDKSPKQFQKPQRYNFRQIVFLHGSRFSLVSVSVSRSIDTKLMKTFPLYSNIAKLHRRSTRSLKDPLGEGVYRTYSPQNRPNHSPPLLCNGYRGVISWPYGSPPIMWQISSNSLLKLNYFFSSRSNFSSAACRRNCEMLLVKSLIRLIISSAILTWNGFMLSGGRPIF